MEKTTKFKKGESGNPKGRPAGIPNRTTSQIREAIQSLVNRNIDGLHDDLTSLDAKDRVRLIIELSRYILPSLKATNLKVDSADIQPIIINFQD